MKIQIEVTNETVLDALNRLIQAGARPRPAMLEIGEELVQSTKRRFEAQRGPDDVAWERNSPETIKRKGFDKPLTHYGTLMDQINYQLINDATLEVGSPTEYAAIHQFGGEIKKAAQSRLVRHRTDASGALLRDEKGLLRFAKDSDKSAVERWFEQAAHSFDMPARPFIGISDADGETILDVIEQYLKDQV